MPQVIRTVANKITRVFRWNPLVFAKQPRTESSL
jgi:hypothetical protein